MCCVPASLFPLPLATGLSTVYDPPRTRTSKLMFLCTFATSTTRRISAATSDSLVTDSSRKLSLF